MPIKLKPKPQLSNNSAPAHTTQVEFHAEDKQLAEAEAAIKQIASILDADNLIFLGEMASKSGINEKIRAKKGMMRTFL